MWHIIYKTERENMGYKNKEKLEELKSLGFSVSIVHLREYEIPRIEYEKIVDRQSVVDISQEILNSPNPTGGVTLVTATKRIGGEPLILKGSAQCSPKDNYCRKLGASIALGRTLKKARMIGVAQEYNKHVELGGADIRITYQEAKEKYGQ